jgi:hypothetical protein
VTTSTDPLDSRALLDVTRRALAACSEGLDASAVEFETPLAAVIFDSLAAVKFIATLEGDLGVNDLPFERWLAQHSERSDALTVGALVEWLRSAIGGGADPERGAGPARGAARDG